MNRIASHAAAAALASLATVLAVSRNGSATQKVKYLVVQVSDTTKPATVAE